MMVWNSVGEFFAMGGYALYVWGSMAVVALCMGGEVLLLTVRTAGARAMATAPLETPPAQAAAGARSSHGVQDEATA